MSNIVAKVIGGDFELSNSIHTPGTTHSRANRAAHLLLGEVAGYPDRCYGSSAIEFGRRFLSNGGSAYIDSDHLEINTPEHLLARDHGLHVHAGLRIARGAQLAVQERLPQGTRIEVLANNCDGHVSYGAHLNVMTTKRTFHDILFRKPHVGALLATYLVTSVLFTGQGMVGAANDRDACDFQLSQRADWFETYADLQTMHHRPLLNTREEPHAGGDLARLHIIYLDMSLAPLANLLRAGATQLVVALCEAGMVDPGLALDDPVEAASAISRDLSLRQTFATAARGKRMTVIEIQQGILDLAAELVATGAIAAAVPDADEILRQWQLALDLLRQRDIDQLARRFDNWLKFLLLDRFRSSRGLSWRSPELKVLDLRYASLDPDEGLFFKMAQAGHVENWPPAAEIEQLVSQPPEETRAWLRGKVLQRYGREVSNLDWSWMDFRVATHRGWSAVARLEMPDPRRFNRSECEMTLAQSGSLEELVEALTPEPGQSGLPSLNGSQATYA